MVHGEPVFIGTRLPAALIADSIDGYLLEDGLSLDHPIAETLESFRPRRTDPPESAPCSTFVQLANASFSIETHPP
jgi:hypothetical protein